LIKVNLQKTNIEDEDTDKDIKLYNYNSSLNIFYNNTNNNKKQNKSSILDNSEFDISNFNKDIQSIKNIQENIILLREQLKDERKRKDNYYKTNKQIFNYTINSSNTLTANNTSHIEASKNIKKKNNLINKNGYTISNYHNYNQNIINKNKSRKNHNKTQNSYINNITITSNDTTPNKNNINTARVNSQNKNNLSNSSINKTVISISTTMTNNNNNNNGFGKKINLSNIYGGSQNDKEDKEINSLRGNSDIINNDNSDRLNNIENENIMNVEREKVNEDEKKIKNNLINNNIKEVNINNLNNKEYNKNFIKKINKKTNLQKPREKNDRSHLNKTPNSIPLKNQYNSFKINKKEKNRDKYIKEKNNNSIVISNKSQKNIKKKKNSLKNNNQSNVHNGNSSNNMNKTIDNNILNLRYNTINNDHYNNFNFRNNLKVKNSHKSKNGSENANKTQKNASEIKLLQNSKVIEDKNNCQQITDNSLKKRNSCKPYYNKNENIKSLNDDNENVDTSINRVQKYLTGKDFKFKSIYDIGIISKAGEITFGETKENQDNYFNYFLGDDLRFIGVCDGHGEYGHHVSNFVRKYLPIELENNLKKLYKDEETKINLLQKEMSVNFNTNTKLNICKENAEESKNDDINQKNNDNIFQKVKRVFEKSFISTDHNLSDFCKYMANLNANEENIFDIEYSGSTCISILLKENNMNKIYIGNVGDSRAIIIKERKNKYWTCQQLSRDHKPVEQDEAQRILEYNGEIEKIEDDDGNWTGPLRVWVKESDGPGLAMTRSFGDEVGASVGVISTPEVGEYKIKEEDRAIIIASDGLWEYMSNKEVTDIFKKLVLKQDVNFIVNVLYKESVKRWKLKDQGIDDITIICILLKSN
jgi:serine/threonine protein phosphatase PrpC